MGAPPRLAHSVRDRHRELPHRRAGAPFPDPDLPRGRRHRRSCAPSDPSPVPAGGRQFPGQRANWVRRSCARTSSSGSPGVGRGGSTPAILSRIPPSRVNSSRSLTETTRPRVPPSSGQSPAAACTSTGRASTTKAAEKTIARRMSVKERKRRCGPMEPPPSARPNLSTRQSPSPLANAPEALCLCLEPGFARELIINRFRKCRTFNGCSAAA